MALRYDQLTAKSEFGEECTSKELRLKRVGSLIFQKIDSYKDYSKPLS